MKTLDLHEMEIISARTDWVAVGCATFAVSAGAYTLGVALNWWNPVGWIGGTAIGVTAIACGSYGLYKALSYYGSSSFF